MARGGNSFTFKNWERFCRQLQEKGISSIPACCVMENRKGRPFLVLKHDIEIKPLKALAFAIIESRFNHRGSFYVQANLLKNHENIKILKKIQEMGHEVSYHHDVLDSNKGDMRKAVEEFRKNLVLFSQNGFYVKTVCQHGNPIIRRAGYSSNRDFFRNIETSKKFKNITDIMVNFKLKIQQDYKYFSDAGYHWNQISDPENDDIIINKENNNVLIQDLDSLEKAINLGDYSVIISTHPHRWNRFTILAESRLILFLIIKKISIFFSRFSFLRRIMEKFYFLAKRV